MFRASDFTEPTARKTIKIPWKDTVVNITTAQHHQCLKTIYVQTIVDFMAILSTLAYARNVTVTSQELRPRYGHCSDKNNINSNVICHIFQPSPTAAEVPPGKCKGSIACGFFPSKDGFCSTCYRKIVLKESIPEPTLAKQEIRDDTPGGRMRKVLCFNFLH